ncbi:MAG: hypothetical protein K0S92_1648 [Desertimonas sp.]|jgi:hypothetical protein|nr:hypothetical protein [Desertimonas sp.]
MRSIRLRIDHVAVEIAEEQRAADVTETLRTALALLATRLAGAPFDTAREAPRRALELLDLTPVAPDWFGRPDAAARLADDLYARIWGAER